MQILCWSLSLTHAESAANRKCLCLNSSESGKVCGRRICSDFYFDKAIMTCRVRLRFSSNLLILCSIFSSHLSPSPPPVGTLGAGWDSRPCCHLLLLQPICAGAAAQHWASLRPSRVWGGHRVLSTACRAAAAQSCSLVMQGCWGHCHSRTRPLVLGTQLGPGV